MALLNFEDLSYKIELRTDDTMTQDATAKTVKILDSSSKCIVGKKFDTLIAPVNGKSDSQNQLEYHQLSTWFTLQCEVKLFSSHIHILGSVLTKLVPYFVDPIYTFPDDPNYGYLLFDRERREHIQK